MSLKPARAAQQTEAQPGIYKSLSHNNKTKQNKTLKQQVVWLPILHQAEGLLSAESETQGL
jgi:hypothetical protein